MPAEEKIEIKQIKYLNNRIEKDHQFFKKRTKSTLEFKNFYSVKEIISGIENIRMIQNGQITGHDSSLSTFQNF